MSNHLELDQIQGLILSGYGERPSAGYAMFEVVNVTLARKWLFNLLPSLQFSEYRASPRGEAPYLNSLCTNIAFTHSGFEAMGLDRAALVGFSHAFQEGSTEPSRARRLGDDGDSAPESWAWGYPGQVLHGVLAVFNGQDDAISDDDVRIRSFIDGNLIVENGVRLVHFLPTTPSHRTLRKEHFGFRDGIANPSLTSLATKDNKMVDTVADGEFILGYPNGYGRLPVSPEVSNAADPQDILPRSLL